MWKRQVRCCQEQKESETDYGTLYTPEYKKKNIYQVLRMKLQHVKIL